MLYSHSSSKRKSDNSSAAKASNSNGAAFQSTITALRAEKEAEDLRKRFEMSQRTQEKLDIRYGRGAFAKPQNPTPATQQGPHATRPKALSQPALAVEKSVTPSELVPAVEKSATTAVSTKAPPPKKDRPLPAPKPKAKPVSNPNPKTTQTKISGSFNSRSSSSSGDVDPEPSYLERLAANNLFNSMSSSKSKSNKIEPFSAFSQSTGPQYKHKVKLISDHERETIEKKLKERESEKNRSRARDTRLKTEERKQADRDKRTEQARDKKIQQILEEAEKKGLDLLEEALNAQVEAFMEKRAVSSACPVVDVCLGIVD